MTRAAPDPLGERLRIALWSGVSCFLLSGCAPSSRLTIPGASPERLWESTRVVYERYSAGNPSEVNSTFRHSKNFIDADRRRARFISRFFVVGWVENDVFVKGVRNEDGAVICVRSKPNGVLFPFPTRDQELERQLIEEIVAELNGSEERERVAKRFLYENALILTRLFFVLQVLTSPVPRHSQIKCPVRYLRRIYEISSHPLLSGPCFRRLPRWRGHEVDARRTSADRCRAARGLPSGRSTSG